MKKEPAALEVAALDAPVILSFLDSLEKDRYNCVRSRNIRLAAIRSFFRWLTLGYPEIVGMATRILATPVKRSDRHLVGFLTREEIDSLLAAPDHSRRQGRRDHALQLTLYNTGARVSEITALHRDHVTFGACASVHLYGKGRKHRDVPLWSKTAHALKAWFRELEDIAAPWAFPSARGQRLEWIPSSSPALTLPSLLSGSDVQTTHGYVEADMATKGATVCRFKPKDDVLVFLATL